jgi:nucleotide-binding universal stress UspA family protein
MIRHGKILVATDFSEPAQEALRRAIVLAQKLDAEIWLVHALEEIVMYDAENLLPFPTPEIMENHQRAAERRMAGQIDSAPEGVEIHACIKHAVRSSSATLCAMAEEINADLIVIGSHGREGLLDHVLVGSTAERVVRHAPCTVLITKPHGIFAGEDESAATGRQD